MPIPVDCIILISVRDCIWVLLASMYKGISEVPNCLAITLKVFAFKITPSAVATVLSLLKVTLLALK